MRFQFKYSAQVQCQYLYRFLYFFFVLFSIHMHITFQTRRAKKCQGKLHCILMNLSRKLNLMRLLTVFISLFLNHLSSRVVYCFCIESVCHIKHPKFCIETILSVVSTKFSLYVYQLIVFFGWIWLRKLRSNEEKKRNTQFTRVLIQHH